MKLPRHLAIIAAGAGPALALLTGWLLMGDAVDAPTSDKAEPTVEATAFAIAASAESAESACEVDGCLASEVSADVMVSDALTGMPRLVEFSSEYCSACAEMKPVVTEAAHSCGATSSLTRVNVEEKRGQSLVARYGVKLLPTFITVDAEGRETGRMVGTQTRERLLLALGDVRGTACPSL